MIVEAYGCVSAAGTGVEALWKALKGAADLARPETGACWQKPVTFPLKAFSWREQSDGSVCDLLVSKLLLAWHEARASLPAFNPDRLGVIYATTKGAIDDLVWRQFDEKEKQEALSSDTCSPVLREFLRRARLDATRAICVSNACASSLCALAVAKHWLDENHVDQVIVLAADRVGPFVAHGFQSLRALSADRVKPFSQDRTGLQLGEAAAAIVFGKGGPGGLVVKGIGIDTEGFAVTRPSESGESLKAACSAALRGSTPDLIVAHGTATVINDATEDRVFTELFGSSRVPVTSTKWCVGHTLGASGAIDLIAACEVLKRQDVFSIGGTSQIDEKFCSSYLHAGRDLPGDFKARDVLLTSLGFGGTHAAVLVGMVEETGKRVASKRNHKVDVRSYEFRYTHPAKEEPGWKHLVDRWYQLDAHAYGLAQAYWALKPQLGEAPSLLFLASPGASNETDLAFVAGGAASPAKFVHTLPNVRASSLCQVMGWHGPMICIQADPATQTAALREASEWVGEEHPVVWVAGTSRQTDGQYLATIWRLSC